MPIDGILLIMDTWVSCFTRFLFFWLSSSFAHGMGSHLQGLEEEDYGWVTGLFQEVANKCCDGRIVSVLEGGYRIQGKNTSAFARSVASHVRALSDKNEGE